MRTPLLLAFLLIVPTGARAQTAVQAPGGTLTGAVTDSATGRPVGYALVVVVGAEQQVFASASGRFVLSGIGSGRLTLRVQQIGYRAVTLALSVNTSPGASGMPGLQVTLARRPVLLPEIVVHGDVCSGTEALGSSPEAAGVIDEALKNAERILALEKSYPFRGGFEHIAVQLDSAREHITRRIDTIPFDTRTLSGYRRGKVLEGGRGPFEVANYFTTSDLARSEFQKWHCFWYAGRDSTTEGPAHRIDFAPLEKTRSPDWAGSLLIDSASMRLVRSEARLVNLRSRETLFRSARCYVTYRQIVPTLVLESHADCETSRTSAKLPYSVARWDLIKFEFVGRSPVTPGPP